MEFITFLFSILIVFIILSVLWKLTKFAIKTFLFILLLILIFAVSTILLI